MNWSRLVVWLSLFVPAFALLGAFSALNSGGPLWHCVAVGGLVGVFFGLAFGGDHRWKFWDYIFGPQKPAAEGRRPDGRMPRVGKRPLRDSNPVAALGSPL